MWKHLDKVQLRPCPFRWHKGISYRDLMKCKSDGVELLGKGLWTKWPDFWKVWLKETETPLGNASMSRKVSLGPCLDLVLTDSSFLFSSALFCQEKHQSSFTVWTLFCPAPSRTTVDLCLASQLSPPTLQYFFSITCLLLFLSLPSSTQEIHLIFLIFSVPTIHSQSSRSSWIIHWNHYH